jgi:hypothetical protein
MHALILWLTLDVGREEEWGKGRVDKAERSSGTYMSLVASVPMAKGQREAP